MSRERKYQQGDFENYYPGRDALRSEDLVSRSSDRSDYVVQRRGSRNVGGGYDPFSHSRPAAHRGKGPRDYRRRDERIVEDINDRLCDNAYIDASEIEVHVKDGDVVLTGEVENKSSKRLAEDIVESVSGVQNVENRLRVIMRGI